MKSEKWQKASKLDNGEMQRFQRILEVQREATLRSLNRLQDETRSVDANYPQDVGDLCTTTLSKESLFQQTGERRAMVRTIEAALARIRQGTFGVCVACGDEINPRRLDALPWTEYCLRCQQEREQEKEVGYPSTGTDPRVHLRRAG